MPRTPAERQARIAMLHEFCQACHAHNTRPTRETRIRRAFAVSGLKKTERR